MGSPGQRKKKKQPTSKEELWEVLKEAEYNIPEDYLRKLQDSLPKTVQDVQREVTLNSDMPLEEILFWKCSVFEYCVHIYFIFWLYLNKDTREINMDGHYNLAKTTKWIVASNFFTVL